MTGGLDRGYNGLMINERLRREILEMRAEDARVRQELRAEVRP